MMKRNAISPPAEMHEIALLLAKSGPDDVRRVLRPGGVYLLNVIDNDPLALVRAQAATLASRFPHVVALARPDQQEVFREQGDLGQ